MELLSDVGLPERERLDLKEKMDNFNYIGQRADKFVVRGVEGQKMVKAEEDDVARARTIFDIEHYTMTCPECDGVGYYDERGEVVCEDCGLVLGGDDSGGAVVPYEYGGSRGFSEDGDGVRGTREPSV